MNNSIINRFANLVLEVKVNHEKVKSLAVNGLSHAELYEIQGELEKIFSSLFGSLNRIATNPSAVLDLKKELANSKRSQRLFNENLKILCELLDYNFNQLDVKGSPLFSNSSSISTLFIDPSEINQRIEELMEETGENQEAITNFVLCQLEQLEPNCDKEIIMLSKEFEEHLREYLYSNLKGVIDILYIVYKDPNITTSGINKEFFNFFPPLRQNSTKKLYSLLVKNGFVDSSTNIASFRSIIIGRPNKDDVIKWCDRTEKNNATNKVSLLHFMDILIESSGKTTTEMRQGKNFKTNLNKYIVEYFTIYHGNNTYYKNDENKITCCGLNNSRKEIDENMVKYGRYALLKDLL